MNAAIQHTATASLIQRYTARLQGIVSEGFHGKTITVVGLGAGSYAAEKLARFSPATIRICDFDLVEIENLARTAYTIDDVGMYKADALEKRLKLVNPFVKIEVFKTSLDAADHGELFKDADLIVAGTDQFQAQALLNEISVRLGIPCVFIGIHERAEGGRVIWSIPGETACYRCLAPERYEQFESGGLDDILRAF